MKFNAEKCVGCEICTVGCSLHRNGVFSLEFGKIKIERLYPLLEDPKFKAFFCKQCRNAKCIQACLPGALYDDPDTRMVVLDSQKCTACGACVDACPFDAIWVPQDYPSAIKCDLCGGDPECIKLCPHDALS